jgi:hypothetical protein
MNFRKRLQNLERQFACDDMLTLIMPDGSQQILALRGRNGILDLFHLCLHDPYCAEAELIRESVSQIDSGGGHMGELIWSFLNSPVESIEEKNNFPNSN